MMTFSLKFVAENFEVITALVAMFIGVYSFFEIRKHHRLSARPVLQFRHTVISTTTQGTPFATLSIKNIGAGVAIKINISAYLDGQEMPEKGRELMDRLRWAARTAGFPNPSNILVAVPDAIAPNDIEQIIRIEGPDTSEYREFLDRFAFVVRFESIYDEIFQQVFPEGFTLPS